MANIWYATPRISDRWLVFDAKNLRVINQPSRMQTTTIVLSDTDVISRNGDNAHAGTFCPLGGAVSAKIFPRPLILDTRQYEIFFSVRNDDEISGHGNGYCRYWS